MSSEDRDYGKFSFLFADATVTVHCGRSGEDIPMDRCIELLRKSLAEARRLAKRRDEEEFRAKVRKTIPVGVEFTTKTAFDRQ